MDPQANSGRDFTIGVYPMLPDETCWFLAADFDKASWQQDAEAFLETCKLFDVPRRWRDRDREMEATPGFSFPSLSLRHWRAKWEPFC
jgi:hypothetical protein